MCGFPNNKYAHGYQHCSGACAVLADPIIPAQLAVGNATKYPEFKGTVAAVYTHPLLHTPGSSGAHYGRDAETYMNVGEAMGKAMVQLRL